MLPLLTPETPHPINWAEGKILLIDKPLTWTSFQAVNKLRYATRSKKIGHAGTLDPLASGLLVLCTGKMTKQIEQFMGQEKEYTGTFVFGKTTPSYDLETQFDSENGVEGLTAEQLTALLPTFTGAIQQVPPLHSAVKVGGKRAYELARKGREHALDARTVEIREFELTRIALPEVDFRVVCSKGTYIRSLAHDLGQAAGTGAHLAALRRTRIGDFRIEQAWQLADLVEFVKNGNP